MEREELIAAIQRLRNAAGTAEEQDELPDTLETVLPASDISDLIFWTDRAVSALFGRGRRCCS